MTDPLKTYKQLNKWQAGEIERLREALEKIEEIAAPLRHSMWHQVHAICKSALVLGRRTHE